MPGYVMRTIKRSQDIKKHLHKHRMQSHFNKTLNLNALLHNYSSAFTNHHFIPIKKESVAFQINKYTYHQLQKDLTEFQDSYPFIEKNIIGKSVLNKNIYELKIGNGDNQVHINASFHGNEWIT